MAGPRYAKYFPLVISTLRELGNSGTPSEVYSSISEKENLSDDELNKRLKNRTSDFENQVTWAKYYLVKAGYVDASTRGVWSLTERGIQENITEGDGVRIIQDINRQLKKKAVLNVNDPVPAIEEKIAPSGFDEAPETDYKDELLEIIRNLTPTGFEYLCKRLLRESGFQEVEVTGRSGDGGIDGRGVLRINSLLSMQVLFQSKRYSANTPVTVSHIRDFRGAMSGRTDKGIFITTSFFTIDAKKEALREGVHPIELVDGERLLQMFEQLQLGLNQETVY